MNEYRSIDNPDEKWLANEAKKASDEMLKEDEKFSKARLVRSGLWDNQAAKRHKLTITRIEKPSK
jgi:hypothetical protein